MHGTGDITWPGWFGAGLAVIAATSLAVATVRVPDVLDRGYDGLRGAPASLREADIAPLGATAPTGVFVAAAKTIPRDATFAVIGGGNDVLAALRLWLTPRVLVIDYHAADWVIVYGGFAPADLRPRARIRLAPTVYALEAAG